MDTTTFSNHLPVRVRFGSGVLSELSELCQQLGVRRPVIVADPVVLDLTPVRNALATLRAQSDTLSILSIPSGEPTTTSIDDIGRQLRELDADLVIAIGGGSAMDTGKGARVLLQNSGSITEYSWPGTPKAIAAPTVALITVPTTAGTGSEVTGGVVMTDPTTQLKVAAPSPHNRAEYCFVDPDVTASLPLEPTLWGGLDALGQAIGSVVASAHTPVGDALGLEAITLLTAALPRVLADLGDAKSRNEVACGALLAGMAMNVAEAGTDHSLAHPLGSLHHLPHGLTVGLMLVESMQHDAQFVPARFERVADAMGAPRNDAGDGSRAISAVRNLLRTARCPTLGECGIRAQDVPALVASAQAGWIPVEPGPWSVEDIRAAYDRALAITLR